LLVDVATIFPLPLDFNADTVSRMKPRQIEDKLVELAETRYEEREKELGADNMRVLEQLVMLRTVDNLWVEHLTMMENMRLQAGWQTLRQTRAVDAYKREGYRQFQTLLDTIQHDVARTTYHTGIVKREAPEVVPSAMAQAAGRVGENRRALVKAGSRKVGRNQSCPCGSGKKYKHCCGR
ncbi:MAG: SEC-C metal-binding domain-containing protein, partial [Dehalococcoidales bacterium]|nr:SEC-C metal-binding domain-containing protein [Dehalococcoidales bacterium]